jgi:hypothetical protein
MDQPAGGVVGLHAPRGHRHPREDLHAVVGPGAHVCQTGALQLQARELDPAGGKRLVSGNRHPHAGHPVEGPDARGSDDGVHHHGLGLARHRGDRHRHHLVVHPGIPGALDPVAALRHDVQPGQGPGIAHLGLHCVALPGHFHRPRGLQDAGRSEPGQPHVVVVQRQDGLDLRLGQFLGGRELLGGSQPVERRHQRLDAQHQHHRQDGDGHHGLHNPETAIGEAAAGRSSGSHDPYSR